MRYNTLKKLLEAVKGGEINDVLLWLDNDTTYVYVNDDEKVFNMHPDELLWQALDLLGIPTEHV